MPKLFLQGSEWDTIHRKLATLRQARSIETGAAIQFQLDEQIKETEAQLAQVDQRLQETEQQD